MNIYGGQVLGYDWLEVGFYQNWNGFYLYAASNISQVYDEVVYSTVYPLTDHSPEIIEIGTQTFEAKIDSDTAKTVTFSIGGDRWYAAEGESANQGNNSLRGHFWDLKYHDSNACMV